MSQSTSPTDREEVLFESEVASEEHAGEIDTQIRVTEEALSADPVPGAESELNLHVPLGDVQRVECSGVLSRTITVDTGEDSYAIPADRLDRVEFTSKLAEQADLANQCTTLGLYQYTESLCGWMTCLGCTLIFVGIGLSLTIIGLFLGSVLVALGLAVLALVALRGKLCDWRGANTWRRPDVTT